MTHFVTRSEQVQVLLVIQVGPLKYSLHVKEQVQVGALTSLKFCREIHKYLTSNPSNLQTPLFYIPNGI